MQWRQDRIGSALRGENPTVIRRLPGGFAVMGDVQWLPGYCVLLTDDPAAGKLSDLARPLEFLASLDRLGRAVESAGRGLKPTCHLPRRDRRGRDRRAFGVDAALITCDDDNVASATVTERCGGVLDPDRPGDPPVRRNWIA